jgi:hypothetical protein
VRSGNGRIDRDRTARKRGMSQWRSDASQFVLVANPLGRRVALFQDALAAAGQPPARVVAWADVLAGGANLADSVRRGDVVRLESPGRDFEVERAILAAGAGEPDEEDPAAHDPAGRMFDRADRPRIDALEFDKGRILWPRQWFLGFRAALRTVARQLAHAPPHRLLNDVADVGVMFDKRACHARLSAAGVAVPPALPPAHSSVAGFDDLLARMSDAGWRRVFVKLAHGSSASGVVAYQVGPRGGYQAVTTVEMVRVAGGLRLYNSRRLRTYRDPREVKALVDALARHRVHVERWVPKAGIDGRTFDLRVVVVAGRAGHTVVRLSRSPITNLHLLNERSDAGGVRRRMGEAAWAAAMATCERAMACFPVSLHGGVDLAVTSEFRRHVVLEVNAFGDLLPGVLHGGLDTYAAQIAAVRGGIQSCVETAGAMPVMEAV